MKSFVKKLNDSSSSHSMAKYMDGHSGKRKTHSEDDPLAAERTELLEYARILEALLEETQSFMSMLALSETRRTMYTKLYHVVSECQYTGAPEYEYLAKRYAGCTDMLGLSRDSAFARAEQIKIDLTNKLSMFHSVMKRIDARETHAKRIHSLKQQLNKSKHHSFDEERLSHKTTKMSIQLASLEASYAAKSAQLSKEIQHILSDRFEFLKCTSRELFSNQSNYFLRTSSSYAELEYPPSASTTRSNCDTARSNINLPIRSQTYAPQVYAGEHLVRAQFASQQFVTHHTQHESGEDNVQRQPSFNTSSASTARQTHDSSLESRHNQVHTQNDEGNSITSSDKDENLTA